MLVTIERILFNIDFVFLNVYSSGINKLLSEIIKSDIVKLHAMWGFGMYLMHLADYLTRRKYNKEERRKESRQQRIVDRKKCRICGKDFDNGSRLGTHMKEKHPGIL